MLSNQATMIMTSPVLNSAVTYVPPQHSGIASDLLAILGLSAIIAAIHGISEACKVVMSF